MNPTTQPTTNGAADPANPGGGRHVGHLYRQVAAYLASRPDTVLKVREVTAAIGAPPTARCSRR